MVRDGCEVRSGKEVMEADGDEFWYDTGEVRVIYGDMNVPVPSPESIKQRDVLIGLILDHQRSPE